MVSIDTSYGLFLHDLRSMLYLERRLMDELGEMADVVTHDDLSDALLEHQTVTAEQVARLENVFSVLGVTPEEHEAADFKGIFDELSHLEKDITDVDLLNLAFLGASMKVEHVEISGYNNLLLMVERFDVDDQVEDLLEENLREEKHALNRLEEVSEESWFEKLINRLNS